MSRKGGEIDKELTIGDSDATRNICGAFEALKRMTILSLAGFELGSDTTVSPSWESIEVEVLFCHSCFLL